MGRDAVDDAGAPVLDCSAIGSGSLPEASASNSQRRCSMSPKLQLFMCGQLSIVGSIIVEDGYFLFGVPVILFSIVGAWFIGRAIHSREG